MNTIIVTGASSGIRASATVRLGAEARNVVLVGRKASALQETAEAVEAAGGNTLCIAEDRARRVLRDSGLNEAADAAFGGSVCG